MVASHSASVMVASRLPSACSGLGWDLATTTKQKSNPSSLSIVEERGVERIVRGILLWKTAKSALAKERVRKVVLMVQARKEGGAARRLSIDATNERYFADQVKEELSDLLPVECVVASETIDIPGSDPVTMKQHLGTLLLGELDDNHLLLPPDRYVKEDWRLVMKEKGQIVCEPDAFGRHGDTFDSTKHANYALVSRHGEYAAPRAFSIGGGRMAEKRKREVLA